MRLITTQKRECGERVSGGIYLSSEGAPGGTHPLWTSLRPPVPCEDRFHRGPVLVDGDRILAEEAEGNWFVAASADRREKMSADQWAIQNFGMTSTMRLRIGECAGLGGVDEAMTLLRASVAYSPVHYKDAYGNMIYSGLLDMPKVRPHLRDFSVCMEKFHVESGAAELVGASASLWRMANALEPRHRPDYIPHLMRMLVVFNLRQDALAMRERFLS